MKSFLPHFEMKFKIDIKGSKKNIDERKDQDSTDSSIQNQVIWEDESFIFWTNIVHHSETTFSIRVLGKKL